MKLFAPALIFCGAIGSFGQSPQVPHKMNFAGMTLTIRDDARREIQTDVDALTKSPKFYNIKAERAKTYFPIIEKVFEEERLPSDFKYLALQESALVPDAVSSSNAVGFWQFKDFTAIEMGLRVDSDIDERMNIASASRGAAKYIKQCNHYFNNWIYALQAYQMGAGGVMRAVGDKDLGTRHMEITSDTYWYVKKYLAHKVAFGEGVQGKPATEVIALNNAGGKTLSEISKESAVSEVQLKEFNKWLKTDRIPDDREYVVLVPKGEVATGFGVLTVAGVAQPAGVPVKVIPVPVDQRKEINGIQAIQAKTGETLSALATRADISISKFLSYNEMEIDRPVKAGGWYFLGKKKKHGEQELYTAQAGEDLWSVSQRFGIRQKMLMKYNSLSEQNGSLGGMTLYLTHRSPGGAAVSIDSLVAELDQEGSFEWDLSLSPARSQASEKRDVELTQRMASDVAPVSSPAIENIHEVKQSDTLYSVARQYGVTIREIMEWNGKKDFSLAVGEKLKVASR